MGSTIKLYEHQIKGSKYLLENKKFCLFWEMATGKTFTVKEALRQIPVTMKILIVAPPKVAKRIWIEELHEGIDVSERDITIVSYKRLTMKNTFVTTAFDVILLDEVHKAKSHSTQVGKILSMLTYKAKYVWGITGTPVDKNFAELYGMFNNLNFPWPYRYKRYEQYIKDWFDYAEINIGIGRAILKPIRVALSKLEYFLKMIAPFCDFKALKDCIDLPEKIHKEVYIEDCDNQTYKYIRKHSCIRFDNYKATFSKGTKHQKLYQACNGFVYDNNHDIIKITNEYPKIEVIKDILEQHNDKVIIVYYYKHDLEILKQNLNNWTEDDKIFEKQPNKQILFMQYDSGEGLNLQFCKMMIFYSYWYKYVSYDQMAARIHRPGMTGSAIYITLIGQNTIEEKVYKAIQKKLSEAEFMRSLDMEEYGEEV